MSANVVNTTPFLRTSRSFPEEIKPLLVEIDKAYVDIANVVNARTIGLFPTTRPAVTGNSFYLANNQKQQSMRQAYNVPAIAAGASTSIPYTTQGFTQFAAIYGTCITDVVDYRPLPYPSTTANANIEVKVTSTNIVITVGAASPNITSGFIVIEWISVV